jgi:D-lactate dehydrogenase
MFLLPSGTKINSADPDADALFRRLEPALTSGLLNLKHQLEGNPKLSARIRQKYQLKNTTGYSLNAFLDYATAVDIFSHLLIGAEGTFAFIAEAVWKPFPTFRSSQLDCCSFPAFTRSAQQSCLFGKQERPRLN